MTRPLSSVAPPETVAVRFLTSDEPRVVRRLAELGLTQGAAVTVLQRSSASLVISTRGSRVAIGLPIAATVIVSGSSLARTEP